MITTVPNLSVMDLDIQNYTSLKEVKTLKLLTCKVMPTFIIKRYEVSHFVHLITTLQYIKRLLRTFRNCMTSNVGLGFLDLQTTTWIETMTGIN